MHGNIMTWPDRARRGQSAHLHRARSANVGKTEGKEVVDHPCFIAALQHQTSKHNSAVPARMIFGGIHT